MLKRISAVLLWALLVVLLAASVALAAPPAGKGNAGAEFDPTNTGPSDTPNGFGAVTSQRATTEGDIGEHSSGFAPGQDPNAEPAQRLGVGNVSRNDGGLAAPDGPASITDPGPSPGDHACLIGDIDGDPNTACDQKPGKP